VSQTGHGVPVATGSAGGAAGETGATDGRATAAGGVGIDVPDIGAPHWSQ
jgi:hypothetical protein